MNDVSQSGGRRFVVQKFIDAGIEGERWLDVAVLEAPDAGAALSAAVVANPHHRIEATSYRVSEEALIVNVSINLEDVTDG